jgi:hypothetical protein
LPDYLFGKYLFLAFHLKINRLDTVYYPRFIDKYLSEWASRVTHKRYYDADNFTFCIFMQKNDLGTEAFRGHFN